MSDMESFIEACEKTTEGYKLVAEGYEKLATAENKLAIARAITTSDIEVLQTLEYCEKTNNETRRSLDEMRRGLDESRRRLSETRDVLNSSNTNKVTVDMHEIPGTGFEIPVAPSKKNLDKSKAYTDQNGLTWKWEWQHNEWAPQV